MPCESDYMYPHSDEIQLSRIHCIFEEIQFGKKVNSHSKEWAGFHPNVYGQSITQNELDACTRDLCRSLSEIEDENGCVHPSWAGRPLRISDLSLEAQIWWRDHKATDLTRLIDYWKKGTLSDSEDQNRLIKLLINKYETEYYDQ